MYGYILQGRRGELSCGQKAGMWFRCAVLPTGGLFTKLRRGAVWRGLLRCGVGCAVMDETLQGEAARWGIAPVPVAPLRRRLLPQLLDALALPPDAAVVLRADCATAEVCRAAAILAGRARYLALHIPLGGAALGDWLCRRYGLSVGLPRPPELTVDFGDTPPAANTLCLGESCQRYQRIDYDAPAAAQVMPELREQFLAALFAAGGENVRPAVKTIQNNLLPTLDRREENLYNAE